MKSFLDDLIIVYGISNAFPHGSRAFKQLQLQDVMRIPQKKPDIEQITSISVNVEITKTNIITTASGQSYEGRVLTGKKLVIEGKINQKLEYVADLVEQSVHASHFFMPFGSYIVLGKDIDCYSEFDVTGYIEDVYIKQLDKRSIFKNVLLLLNAVPVPR